MNKKEIVFKIRCSAIGLIMPENKGTSITEKQLIELEKLELKEKRTVKQEETYRSLVRKKEAKPELSQGAKTYCEKWLKEQMFNRREQIDTNVINKGIIGEDDSIKFLVDNGFLFIAEKNIIRKFNSYMTGECDVEQPNSIWDIKTSWSLFTFPMFKKESDSSLYKWQGQGYLELWDKEEFVLAYVLGNTPEEIIQKELEWKGRDIEFLNESEYNEFEKNIRKNHNFDDIDFKNRVVLFRFKRDRQKAIKIKEKVAMCQEYIDKLIEANF